MATTTAGRADERLGSSSLISRLLGRPELGAMAGTVLVFLPAVGDFVSAQLLGGPNTYMIGNLIQQQFFGAENWPFGAALTTLMMLFLMVWMVFYLRSAARAAREAVVA